MLAARRIGRRLPVLMDVRHTEASLREAQARMWEGMVYARRIATAALVWFLLSSAPGCAFEVVTLPSADISEFALPGEDAPGKEFFNATALALGSEGGMWFTQATPGRLDRIAPSGILNGEFVVPTGFYAGGSEPEISVPVSMARGAGGKMWFADDGQTLEGQNQNLVGFATPAGCD